MPEYDDCVRDPKEEAAQDAEMPKYDDFQDVELEPDEDEIRPMPEDVALQPDPCPDIDVETKRHVRVAHRNLAHPSRETFVRMLRLGGATAEAIRYAKLWTCTTLCNANNLQPVGQHKCLRRMTSTISLAWI